MVLDRHRHLTISEHGASSITTPLKPGTTAVPVSAGSHEADLVDLPRS